MPDLYNDALSPVVTEYASSYVHDEIREICSKIGRNVEMFLFTFYTYQMSQPLNK